MDPALVVDIGRQALTVVILVAGPLLIPKILAIVGMLFFMLPWMILKLVDFVVNLFNSIPTLID